jgi:type III secretion system HrpB7-like protein
MTAKKDRRVVAFERVLSRRRQLDRKLNAALCALRSEATVLRDIADAHRAAVEARDAELAQHDGKIDSMLAGTSFRANKLLMLREFRSHLAEHRATLEAQVLQAAQAVTQKEAEIAAVRANIVRNRARIDTYGERRDELVKAIELAIEDAQDEEASENRRPDANGARTAVSDPAQRLR